MGNREVSNRHGKTGSLGAVKNDLGRPGVARPAVKS